MQLLHMYIFFAPSRSEYSCIKKLQVSESQIEILVVIAHEFLSGELCGGDLYMELVSIELRRQDYATTPFVRNIHQSIGQDATYYS